MMSADAEPSYKICPRDKESRTTHRHRCTSAVSRKPNRRRLELGANHSSGDPSDLTGRRVICASGRLATSGVRRSGPPTARFGILPRAAHTGSGVVEQPTHALPRQRTTKFSTRSNTSCYQSSRSSKACTGRHQLARARAQALTSTRSRLRAPSSSSGAYPPRARSQSCSRSSLSLWARELLVRTSSS